MCLRGSVVVRRLLMGIVGSIAICYFVEVENHGRVFCLDYFIFVLKANGIC